jgi:hypothetical protein
VYAKAGFTVSTIIMDYEFEKVPDHVPSTNINTTAASEHVGEIVRKICVVKEQAKWNFLYPTLQDTTSTTGHPPSSLCCHVVEQLSCG